jgi:sulfite oxidase
MNGEPLPRDHGFPVRVLMPGIVGARNVKWLERIVLRNDEGLGPWNNHYYNSKDLPKEHKAFQSGHSLELQSLFTTAALRNAVHGSNGGVVDVSGVSYSGDGAEIAKVREKTISFTFRVNVTHGYNGES